MSPERVSKGGQYRTNWVRKEVGRIRVTYGYTVKEHSLAVKLLDELYDNDQLEILRALKARQITIKALVASRKGGRNRRDDLLVDLRLRRPLWTTLEAMVKLRRGGDKHRTRLLT